MCGSPTIGTSESECGSIRLYGWLRKRVKCTSREREAATGGHMVFLFSLSIEEKTGERRDFRVKHTWRDGDSPCLCRLCPRERGAFARNREFLSVA